VAQKGHKILAVPRLDLPYLLLLFSLEEQIRTGWCADKQRKPEKLSREMIKQGKMTRLSQVSFEGTRRSHKKRDAVEQCEFLS